VLNLKLKTKGLCVKNNDMLSLPMAILINVNIMLGAGIFINTVELAKLAGVLGCLAYPLIGIILLPLIISMARLVHLYPEASFYGFGAKAIHPFVGFLSGWSYFTGKLASATLMIHVAFSLLQQIIPALQIIPILLLDGVVFMLFVFMNMFQVRTGSAIQMWFLVFKSIPIIFVILSGLFLFSGAHISTANALWDGIPATLPFVLYATAGFEATCSLSSRIENAKVNGPRAIYLSYTIVVILAFMFQFLLYAILGSDLGLQANYLAAFPMLLQKIFASAAVANIVQGIMYAAIASSAFGAAYGVLYSNYWNVFALAQAGHTFCKNQLTALNKLNVPYASVLLEGVIGLLYLALIRGQQIPLQQTSALSGAISYTLSVAALLYGAVRLRMWKKAIIPTFALASCLLLVVSCIDNFIRFGLYPLYVFLALLIAGVGMFAIQMRKKCE